MARSRCGLGCVRPTSTTASAPGTRARDRERLKPRAGGARAATGECDLGGVGPRRSSTAHSRCAGGLLDAAAKTSGSSGSARSCRSPRRATTTPSRGLCRLGLGSPCDDDRGRAVGGELPGSMGRASCGEWPRDAPAMSGRRPGRRVDATPLGSAGSPNRRRASHHRARPWGGAAPAISSTGTSPRGKPTPAVGHRPDRGPHPDRSRNYGVSSSTRSDRLIVGEARRGSHAHRDGPRRRRDHDGRGARMRASRCTPTPAASCTSIRYSERLAELGAAPSVGSAATHMGAG